MWFARNRMMSSLHAAARPVSGRSLAVATLLAEQHWEEPIDGGMPADEAFLKYAGVYVKGFHGSPCSARGAAASTGAARMRTPWASTTLEL